MVYNFEEYKSLKDKSNLFFLFGEEDFFVYRAYKKILEEFSNNNKISIQIVDCEELKKEDSLFDLLENMFSIGLFGERKVVVFKSIEKLFPGKSKKTNDQLLESKFRKSITNLENGIFIIFISYDSSLYGIGKKLKSQLNDNDRAKFLANIKFPFNFLLDVAICFEFPKVYESQYRSILKGFFSEAGYSIDDSAIDFILSHTESNLWSIYSEFEKITIYFNKTSNITLNNIQRLIVGNKTNSVFDLVNYVAQRNLNKSIEVLQQILSTSHQEILITSQLLKYFRNLLVVSDLTKSKQSNELIAKEIGVSPYFFRDYLIGLKNYTKSKIQQALSDIISVDYTLKSSTTAPIFLLTELLIKIISK